MRPLADDTSIDVETRLIAAWRRMSAAEKAALVMSANRAADAMARAGIRDRYPNASSRELFLRLAILKLGYDLALQAFPEIEKLRVA